VTDLLRSEQAKARVAGANSRENFSPALETFLRFSNFPCRRSTAAGVLLAGPAGETGAGRHRLVSNLLLGGFGYEVRFDWAISINFAFDRFFDRIRTCGDNPSRSRDEAASHRGQWARFRRSDQGTRDVRDAPQRVFPKVAAIVCRASSARQLDCLVDCPAWILEVMMRPTTALDDITCANAGRQV
jgi:hypothetical protein